MRVHLSAPPSSVSSSSCGSDDGGHWWHQGGEKVRGRVHLSAHEAQATDSIHFVVRGQEFSLVYYKKEDETTWQAAAQAHVFYEKSYDYRVRKPTNQLHSRTNDDDDMVIPFSIPLPEALPATALLHLTTSENFIRIQYKLQVFRTGQDMDNSQVSFQHIVGRPSNFGEQQSCNAPGGLGSRNPSNASSSNNNQNNNQPRIQQILDPIPKEQRLRELYVHHTRASPNATPLLVRAPAWNEQHQATTHLHVQVVERVEMVRSAFCGLYDYTTITFRLLTQPSSALYVSPGKDVRLLLTDPDNFLRTWIKCKTTFVLIGKVTQTIHWRTCRRFVAYPIQKTWDLPEIVFDVEPLSEETKDGVFDEHILLDKAITFPPEPAETFEGSMLSIKSVLMLGLCFVDPATGDKRAAGATPNLPLQVRGGGGLSLITKEAVV